MPHSNRVTWRIVGFTDEDVASIAGLIDREIKLRQLYADGHSVRHNADTDELIVELDDDARTVEQAIKDTREELIEIIPCFIDKYEKMKLVLAGVVAV